LTEQEVSRLNAASTNIDSDSTDFYLQMHEKDTILDAGTKEISRIKFYIQNRIAKKFLH